MSVRRIEPKSFAIDMGMDDRFTFGKYLGRSLLYVIGEEPSYIRWLLDDGIINISTDANEMYRKSVYAQRYGKSDTGN